ncbi:MAG TPA: hypothetical protein VKY92_25805 [Verrucomicrobiae bacterium]|nr:hypothetical protein [Verrucomicrobiae bacterium]
MRLNWKVLGLTILPVLLLSATGCGGLSATKSISPASFLLPGLIQATPPPAHPESTLPQAEPGTEVAQF